MCNFRDIAHWHLDTSPFESSNNFQKTALRTEKDCPYWKSALEKNGWSLEGRLHSGGEKKEILFEML